MTLEQKGNLIAAIISHLKFEYRNKIDRQTFEKQIDIKPFDEGETFFRLAFMTDANLQKIANPIGA